LRVFIDFIDSAALWPWVRLSLWQKLVPLTFFGGQGEGGGRRPMHRAGNFATFMCQLSRNPGSLTLLEPQGLSRSLQG